MKHTSIIPWIASLGRNIKVLK
ncbi:hypothetical protein NC652_000829 [Populus alba x Populus x berolinensis]|uniref:Uncharacterized protein n=1 Tax=Populus alba x Populus x berolinensis TaxID=444605 RepID=A0AAD6WEU7_9ROSI|nr:hypothetical protein NC651_000057 [Populus alba x Populus x berolinensis]KAJ6961989.1 hypothetical protein NC652_000829 [Populus alba x Populus x berolinensis]KAJ7009237.1 hypothetical protein NC653_000020 [Populus alba x Populus x berolinensis]KAJ7009261.1 hypothetical protein NC653_000041 [Populus alba x Populus x berolinensis]